MDLRDMIKAVDITCISDSESTILDANEFVSRRDIQHTDYIVSLGCLMKELLIVIEFKDNIDLQSITLHSLLATSKTKNQLSAPKTIHICHVNTLYISLDDIEKVKPAQSIDCTPDQLNQGQTIHLQQFEGTKYVAIYIPSNQKDTEYTYLNGIAFTGHCNNKQNENANKPISDDHKQDGANASISDSHIVTVHFDDQQFDYPLMSNPDDWDEDTTADVYHDLLQSIRNKFSLQSEFALFEDIGGTHMEIDDMDDILSSFDGIYGANKVLHLFIHSQESKKVNRFKIMVDKGSSFFEWIPPNTESDDEKQWQSHWDALLNEIAKRYNFNRNAIELQHYDEDGDVIDVDADELWLIWNELVDDYSTHVASLSSNVTSSNTDVAVCVTKAPIEPVAPTKNQSGPCVQILQFKRWFDETLQLPQYYWLFKDKGYGNVDDISGLNDEMLLNDIGIASQQHRTKILNEIHKLLTQESKQDTDQHRVPCICGIELTAMMAHDPCFKTNKAACSSCGRYLEDTETVYHCEKESNNWHLKGYNLCEGCADFEIALKEMYPDKYGPQQGIPLQYTGMGITSAQNVTGKNARFETPSGQKKRVPCVCGSALIETTAQNAYANGDQVECDRCGACLKGTIVVFHCPNESNNWHPNGCDLCQGCADWAVGMQQMNSQPNQMAVNVQNTQFEFDKSDTNARKHLSEMLQSDDSDQKVGSSPFDAESLFGSNIIRSTTESCKLTTCDSLKRLHIILNKYHLYINTLQQKLIDTLYDETDYNNTALLNDFNHLLRTHANEFEDIHAILTESDDGKSVCPLTKCVMIRRNRRNRSKEERDLYFGQDERNMNKQQLLDKIHSYYIHSFDTGYKLTRKDREHIVNDDDVKMGKDDDDTLVDLHVRRFGEVMRQKNTEYETEELAKKQSKYTLDTDVMEYSYGIRYFYWTWYANNLDINDYAHRTAGTDIDIQKPPNGAGVMLQEWYVAPKYKSFKEELLHNAICVISLLKWQMLELKAKDHLHTDFVRQFKCPRTTSAACYDMKYGQNMSINHLISLMTYCNFSGLAKAFTETFRRNENETNLALKERHRNFYYLGRLLRECCECFGMTNRWRETYYNTETMKVYHGINNHFMFQSAIAFIKGPTSTTTDYAVAVKFGGVKGMVLQLNIHVPEWILKNGEGEEAMTRLSCFDMQWISDFPNESEIFFVGGLNHFTFGTIIEARSNVNYKMYIRGLNQMTFHMSTGEDSVKPHARAPVTIQEKAIVYRLLSNEIFRWSPESDHGKEFKSCPEYMQSIVRRHCTGIESIAFESKLKQEERDTVEHCKLHDALFKYDNEWIKLDLIIKVFPNTKHISYSCTPRESDVAFVKQASIYNSVLDFIHNNPGTKLLTIAIDIQILDMAKDIQSQAAKAQQIPQDIIFHIQHFVPLFNRFYWNIDVAVAETGVFMVNMINLNVY